MPRPRPHIADLERADRRRPARPSLAVARLPASCSIARVSPIRARSLTGRGSPSLATHPTDPPGSPSPTSIVGPVPPARSTPSSGSPATAAARGARRVPARAARSRARHGAARGDRLGPGSEGPGTTLLGEYDDARLWRWSLQPHDVVERRRGSTWSPLRVERATPPWVGGFPEIAVDRDPGARTTGPSTSAYNWLGRGAHGPGFRLLASADFGGRGAESRSTRSDSRLALATGGGSRIGFGPRPTGRSTPRGTRSTCVDGTGRHLRQGRGG